MLEANIKYRDELLDGIATGLKQHEDVRICNLEVILSDGDGNVVLKTSVPDVLNYIANDIYWDEETDWSKARLVEVRTM